MKIKSWEGKFSMYILIFATVVLVLMLITAVWFFKREKTDLVSGETVVKIADGEYVVEIADSPAKKAQGLSGRDGLDEGEGMLFPFDPPSANGFWMRGMKFPIDIIWIFDKEVISIKENAPVPSGISLPVYKPDSPADLVLEVRAGEVEKQGIKVGDKVEIR